MRCSWVRTPRAATRRSSTIPRSRSPAACGVAPKLELFSSLRTSALLGLASSVFGEPRFHIPLPTPGGHAGLRSTSFKLAQEASRNAAPKSKATLMIARRNHSRMKLCCPSSYYYVEREEGESRRCSVCSPLDLNCSSIASTAAVAVRCGYNLCRVRSVWTRLSIGRYQLAYKLGINECN